MQPHSGLLHWEATQALRDSSQRPLAQPLLRLAPPPEPKFQSNNTNYPSHVDVLIAGAGPAGLFLHLLLSRYGLTTAGSLLCIDAATTATKAGHADGIMPRTLEILRGLDLSDEIERHGHGVYELTTWTRKSDGKISRDSVFHPEHGNGRFGQRAFLTRHQGTMERILEDDLAAYGGPPVLRQTRLLNVEVEEEGEYPVIATLQRQLDGQAPETFDVRAKYLVGADGAHSTVRSSVGIKMEGTTGSDIYGVIDFIPDSDYPDIRRQSHITADDAVILHIPREPRGNGERGVRLYVGFGAINETTDIPPTEEVAITGGLTQPTGDGVAVTPKADLTSMPQVTIERIFEQANKVFAPYTIKPKDIPGAIEWWAAYRVGQRVAAQQVYPSGEGQRPRVFLIGDAAHTHTPKLGQGMNVSMGEAYNLAWKLAHVQMGLVPAESEVDLLRSLEAERRPVAVDLIDLDKLWYKARYAEIKVDSILPQDRAVEVLQYISGYGLEYGGGTLLVADRPALDDMEELHRVREGKLRTGRRLPEVQLTRFADGAKISLLDDCPGSGIWRVLVFTAADLLDPHSISAGVVRQVCALANSYPGRMLEPVVLHSKEHLSFEWTDVPKEVLTQCEMKFHRVEDGGYDLFGVDKNDGRVVLVRPDGMLAHILPLHTEGVASLEKFLNRLLKREQQVNGIL